MGRRLDSRGGGAGVDNKVHVRILSDNKFRMT